MDHLTVSLLRDADGDPQYQLALMEDTTERRLLNLRLRYEATHDALTGCPTGRLLRRLEKALGAGEGRGSACATSTWTVQDRQRQPRAAAGDRCSSRSPTAAGLRHRVRRDGGPARRRRVRALTTGPDTERTVDELAARIMNALLAPISVDGRELTVRGSIGIVEGPAGERSAAEVLRSADITMYRAKSAGGNRFELADPEADARAITGTGSPRR
ncbi:hypothetical protein GCM10023238_00290 [Streptomyces heliomycini]